MNKKKKLGSNVLFMTAGNFASKMLSFLLIPMYTAVLSTAEYGIADIMTTTITLLAPIFTLQINEAILRFCLDKNSNKEKILTIGIFIISIGFFIMILMSPIVFIFPNLKKYYLLFLIYYISSTLYTILSQFTKGIEMVKEYAIGGVLDTAIVIACNIFSLVYLKLGVFGYITSFIIGNFIVSVYLIIITKAYKKFKLSSLDIRLMKTMINYSAPMIPNSISWWITNSSDKYMVTFFVGTSANGLYSIAYKIPSLLSTINGIFMSAWNISAVEGFGSRESKKFFSETYLMLSTLDAIIVSGLVLFAKPIARILYSNDFFVAWKYAIVLILGYMFSSLSSFLGSVYTTSKRTTALFYTSVIGAFINIVLNIIMIPLLGVLGAAIATTFSYITVWLIRVFHTKKIYDFDKCIFKNCICGGIIMIQIIAVYMQSIVTLIISIVCFLLIVVINWKFIIETLKLFKIIILKKCLGEK